MRKTPYMLMLMLTSVCLVHAESFPLTPAKTDTYVSVYEHDASKFSIVTDFDEGISVANAHPIVTSYLSDYQQIGFKDTLSLREYTLFIAPNGTILAVSEGIHKPDVTFKGDSRYLHNLAKNGQFGALYANLDMPLRMRIKNLWRVLFS